MLAVNPLTRKSTLLFLSSYEEVHGQEEELTSERSSLQSSAGQTAGVVLMETDKEMKKEGKVVVKGIPGNRPSVQT